MKTFKTDRHFPAAAAKLLLLLLICSLLMSGCKNRGDVETADDVAERTECLLLSGDTQTLYGSPELLDWSGFLWLSMERREAKKAAGSIFPE